MKFVVELFVGGWRDDGLSIKLELIGVIVTASDGDNKVAPPLNCDDCDETTVLVVMVSDELVLEFTGLISAEGRGFKGGDGDGDVGAPTSDVISGDDGGVIWRGCCWCCCCCLYCCCCWSCNCCCFI